MSSENKLSTGTPGLDEVLHGGLIPGRLYLVDGDPGAGKTTLSLRFLIEGRDAGQRCLYVTLSESEEELRAGAASHGWSLEGIEICELIADELGIDGEGDLTMYHPSEVELTATTRRALDEVERVKPHRIVFDSLSELRLLAQGSLRYRRQVLAIKHFFVKRNCTVLMLDDRTAEGPDLQLQSIAHGVISLQHEAPPYGRAMRQLRVIKFRGSDFRSGKHDFTINRGGLAVFPRLAASAHGSVFVRAAVSSGLPGLDALLGGGIDAGTSTLLVGPPGTGKSTVALQYAVAAAHRGERAAIFGFEESETMIRERARGIGVEVPSGLVTFSHVDPAEISPGEFASLVRHAVEQDGARVVVIDSLNGYLNAMPDDRFLAAQLHELLAYLSNHGVASFLISAQSGVMGSQMRSPVDASYLADVIIMFRLFEHAGQVKKAVSVMKKRSGRHEETIRELWFDDNGLHLSEPLARFRGVLTGVPVEVSEPTTDSGARPAATHGA